LYNSATDPSLQKRIFDIFQTLDPAKSKSTGIGLAIVQKIVESQGGSIWVESSLGQDSAFSFTWR
jgi:signal transduction histidine kinase